MSATLLIVAIHLVSGKQIETKQTFVSYQACAVAKPKIKSNCYKIIKRTCNDNTTTLVLFDSSKSTTDSPT